MMMVLAKVTAVEMVRSGQILETFWKKANRICLQLGYRLKEKDETGITQVFDLNSSKDEVAIY